MSIPRVVHACWFGGAAKPAGARRAAQSWRSTLEGWEVREWHEGNLKLPSNRYVDWCVTMKRWAYLSDYARAFLLHEFGGVYVDYDVVVKQPLDMFLEHRAFSGFEVVGLPFTAVWGAEAGHPWPKYGLDYLDDLDPTETLRTNTQWMSDILVKEFGINPNVDTFQMGNSGVAIYPSEIFCVETAVSWAVHEFEGSWLPLERRTYKDALQRRWDTNALLWSYEMPLMRDLGDLTLWMLERRHQETKASLLLGHRPGSSSTRQAGRAAARAIRRIARMSAAGLVAKP